MKNDYVWRIASNPAHVPPLVKTILEILKRRLCGLTQEEYGDIKLILNELVFNAVLHGNNADEGKFVHIAMCAGDKTVCVSITDEGDGFNVDSVRRRIMDDDYLKMENGRGIALANALADEINYSNEGRTVTFKKYIGLINPVLTGA